MATDVNRVNRKRKSNSDLIFEVDEEDCSPSSSSEPIAESASCSVSETEVSSQASADVNKTVVGDDFKQTKPDVDLRCMDMEVDSSSPSPPDMDKPFVTLIFRDKNVANRLKYQIINFIKRMANFTLNEESESDLKVNLWENRYHYDSTVKHCLNNSAFVDTKSVDLFVVDTTPSKNREMLPRYSPNRIIDELDPDIANGKPNEKDKSNYRPHTVCFNCDGNHSMKDCTETRDYRRITVARNKYMSNSQAKNIRYHKDEEQRYKHLVPGKISDKLRRALDLRRHEIPSYVYGMRTLGYPPGWLKEALITNTKIQMFDFHGCAVNDVKSEKKVIDPDKVVEYPGFNVPLEEGFKDEYKYYKCPPYDENHSKKTMLNFVMKMVDENQEQWANTVSPCTQEPMPPGCVELDSNSQDSESKEPKKNRSESPTLTDLELRKRQLLAELEDGNLNSPQPTVTENGDKSVSEIPSPCVTSSTFGTPILKSASPYAQLPDRDKFSKDISQVINFENLPNSTGKYEKMSKVISKVRGKVKTDNTNDNDKS
ncbi:uncharacterized protein CBL_00734 [Carabus blaptoides fortunei]